LDVNKNGRWDENEPRATTDENGLFQFEVSLEEFDTNNNAEIDPEEGHIMIVGGIDTANGLPLETPLKATPDSLVVSLVTSLIVDLIDEGWSQSEANNLVKQKLSLPEDVDLTTFDPIAATSQNIAGGAQVNLAMVQLQNVVTQTTAFISGVSTLSKAEISGLVVRTIANQVQTEETVDLISSQQLETILVSTAQTVQEIDPALPLNELLEMSESAAQVMAATNEQMAEAVFENTASDINEAIAIVQQVSLNTTTQDLAAASSGAVSIDQVVENHTGDRLEARIANVAQNNGDNPPRTNLPNGPISLSMGEIDTSSLWRSSEDSSSEENTDATGDRLLDVTTTLFDSDYYLTQNPDVADAITIGTFQNAAEHFALFGFAEGRVPSELFAEAYLTQNPDVAEAVANGLFPSGLAHFVQFGFTEGRYPSDHLQDFALFYLSQNPDAAEAIATGSYSNALDHLIQV
ncbi:MAG TPA: hypothetical protein V6D27_07565, partial [Vampirovibrionales bacterium]